MKLRSRSIADGTLSLSTFRNRFRGDWLLGAASLTLVACSASSLSDSADEGTLEAAQQALTPSSTRESSATSGLVAAAAPAPLVASGTWSALPANTLTNTTSTSIALLTDGTLLVQSSGDWHTWSRFTPSTTGSYASGTWTAAASTAFGRLYYPFGVLKDGRFFVAGGEYLSGTESNQAALEIYDPVSNVWARQPDSPLGDIGDVAYQILTDGRIVMGHRFTAQVEIFNPATATWSAGPDKGVGTSTEETWSLLPNGTVLNWVAAQPQLYLPSSNTWVNASKPPALMQDTNAETGPAVFLTNGKLLAFGAFGNTALYTPGATTSGPGSWTLGPSAPPPTQANNNPNHSQYMEDVPACIEPNGKVLFVSSDSIFGHGNFNEYDPVTNTVTAIVPPAIPDGTPSYLLQMVALPTGQILVTGTGTSDYLYTPTGTPSDAWRPTIQSVTTNTDGSYTLSGTQLNGVSQGASYGDEGNAQTNFPLIRLTSGTTVRYARSYAFSTMGFATGSALVSSRFRLPTGIPAGTYQLAAVTNGIASAPVSFTVGQAQNQPPTASITLPLNNAMFNAPAQITINANAADADGTISKVEFYRGTTLLGTDTTAPYSFVWANVAAGSYSLTVKAYDNLNAVTTSSAVAVVVGSTGTNPCAGLCTSPLVFAGPSYQSGNLGTGAVCRETTSVLHGGNCSNLSARTLKVNGVTMSCSSFALPAAVRGGYCVQVTAGTPDYASFATW